MMVEKFVFSVAETWMRVWLPSLDILSTESAVGL